MKTHSRMLVQVAIPAFLVAGAWLYAGPLNPPAGPIVSTGKTTQEIFDKVGSSEPRVPISLSTTPGDANSLYKITQPGSYYLTGNITGVAGKHGIEIASGEVTLDLNGFTLQGIAGMGAFDGINASVASLRGIKIRNGNVRDWGGEGIDLFTATALFCTVEGIYARSNASHGIYMDDGSTVIDCAANLNGGSGIDIDSGARVERCRSSGNVLFGIDVGTGIVRECYTTGNDASGIFASNSTTVEHCKSDINGVDGIVAGSSSVIRHNTCSSNGVNSTTGAGVHITGVGAHVEANRCITADRGILVDAGSNTIVKNICVSNSIDWIIAVNNIYGPIIDRRAPATAFVNGFAATGTMGSTDPNANFSIN